jgi:hypothetical protein
MDLRGIYMSAEKAEVTKYANSLVKVTDQISVVIADWQRGVRKQRRAGVQQLCGANQRLPGFPV